MYWDLYRDGVTQSSLGTFLSCPERMRLSYKEGLTPARWVGSTFALDFGDLFHRGLDEIYTFWREEGSVPSFRSILNDLRDTDEAKVNVMMTEAQLYNMEINYGFAEILLREYLKHWKLDFGDVAWEGLEEKFDIPYASQIYPGRNIRIRGKMDGRYRIGAHNDLWLFETKTKSRIEDSIIADKLSYDLQVMVYMWALSELVGEQVKGVKYNLIRRPGLRHGVRETTQGFLDRVRADVEGRPEHYFLRYEAALDPHEIDRWKKDMQSIMLQIERWFRGDFNYKNPGACGGGFVTCPYIDICGKQDYTAFTKNKILFTELTVMQSSSEQK